MSHKLEISQHFSRAAVGYTQHNELQRQCAAYLLAQLPAEELGVTLDIGCGPGVNSEVLQQRASHYVGMDLAVGMLQQAQQRLPALHWVQGDMEHLPLAPASVHTLYANLALQWADQPLAALRQWVACVKPQGRIVASTVLQGSLQPLSGYLLRYTGHRRHNSFLTYQELQQQLALLNGVAITVEQQTMTVRYPTVLAMLHQLKGIGANYQYHARPGLTKGQLQRVATAMEIHRDPQGLLPLHWQIAFITLRKTQ